MESNGPLKDLGDTLSGHLAGDYSPRITGDDTATTQVPLDDDVSPLDRPASEDPIPQRDEDADGAPEL